MALKVPACCSYRDDDLPLCYVPRLLHPISSPSLSDRIAAILDGGPWMWMASTPNSTSGSLRPAGVIIDN